MLPGGGGPLFGSQRKEFFVEVLGGTEWQSCLLPMCGWAPDLFLIAAGLALAGMPFTAHSAALGLGDQPVELVLGGDVLLAANLSKFHPDSGTPLDYGFMFERVAPYLRHADIAFCNLECPISGRGKRADKLYAFNAPPAAAGALAETGFDVVSLANNHCLDYGIGALNDTLEQLAKRGIQYAGICIRNQPQVPRVIGRRGVRIAFLAYVWPGLCEGNSSTLAARPAEADRGRVVEDIRAVRGEADMVVVSIHWGVEYVPQADAVQQAWAHAIIDAGANAIVGHHPHVQQSYEWYNNGLILYSLGNFAFGEYSRPPARSTRLYRLLVGRKGIVGAEYLPIKIAARTGRPEPSSDQFISLAAEP